MVKKEGFSFGLTWKISWRREWLPTPVFLPGEVHGQRSLTGYSPWGGKESDIPEQPTDTGLDEMVRMEGPLMVS